MRYPNTKIFTRHNLKNAKNNPKYIKQEQQTFANIARASANKEADDDSHSEKEELVIWNASNDTSLVVLMFS